MKLWGRGLAVLTGALILLTGCSSQNLSTDSGKPTANATTTGAPQQAELPKEFDGMTVQEATIEMDMLYSPTMDNVQAYAEETVRGIVTGFSYIAVDAQPWTVIHVNTDEGERDVYTFGGYISTADRLGDALNLRGGDMSEEEAQSTLIHYTFDGSALPEIGQEYLFYVTTRAESEGALAGQYERLCGEYGQFLVAGDQFIRQGCAEEAYATQTYTANDLAL